MARRGGAAVLSATAALLAVMVPGSGTAEAPSAHTADTTVRIGAKQIGDDEWVSTGIQMHKGQTWKLTATGRINYCGGSPDPNDSEQPQCDSTPDGSVSGENHCGGPAPCGALIGRFANTTTEFPVGSEKIFKGVKGTLELQVNDFGDPSNNEGGYTARIKLTKGDPTPGAGFVAQVAFISATRGTPRAQVFRDGTWEPLTSGTDLKAGDRIRTDQRTRLEIDFDLGGKILVQRDSEVEIRGERSAGPTRGRTGLARLTKGGVWAKCGRMSDSLDIQMTGGVMGIKG